MATQSDIVIGKHTLESLTIGMYADPFTLYREYIQNGTDSIDSAVNDRFMDASDGRIDVIVDSSKSIIVIKDNGTGIDPGVAVKTLGDIGNSAKDYREQRGFRGIGRLGGLGYCKRLSFRTTCIGSNQIITITWDCEHLKELLQPGKYKEYDLLKVIREVTTVMYDKTEKSTHFFEVRLIDIDPLSPELLDSNQVDAYLSAVAPVPFNFQTFIDAKKIRKHLVSKKLPFEEYNVYLNSSPKPILKRYTSTFRTGHQERTKQQDQIKDIEFFEYLNDNGIVYVGWHAITNFYGSVNDDYMRGIRVRKGNILIGTELTFCQFFPVEKDVANSWFIGEVYVFDKDVIPNARRDNFEKNAAFERLFSELSKKADDLNRRYRRQMSKYNSLIKGIDGCKKDLVQIRKEIDSGGITSDAKKEQLIEKKEDIEKRLDSKQRELQKVAQKYDNDDEKKNVAERYIREADELKKKVVEIENTIVNADYSTKKDLPSYYSKAERKVYQTIIKVIDEHLDESTAKMLRKKIIDELTKSRKSR